jgi:hypothetical protein
LDQRLSERRYVAVATCRPLLCLTPSSSSDRVHSVRPCPDARCLVSMSQHSEERVSDPVVPVNVKAARVIPFERPQSELQKAVQKRAQETMDRERDRANQKPPAWRRALVLVLAAVPVVLTFGAALGFVGALRQFNSAVFEGAKNSEQQQSPPAGASASQSEPGVVILQPYDKSQAPANGTAVAPISPAPR